MTELSLSKITLGRLIAFSSYSFFLRPDVLLKVPSAVEVIAETELTDDYERECAHECDLTESGYLCASWGAGVVIYGPLSIR